MDSRKDEFQVEEETRDVCTYVELILMNWGDSYKDINDSLASGIGCKFFVLEYTPQYNKKSSSICS